MDLALVREYVQGSMRRRTSSPLNEIGIVDVMRALKTIDGPVGKERLTVLGGLYFALRPERLVVQSKVRFVEFPSLGPQTARLGQIYLHHLDVNDVAGPILQALVDESQETAHLGVLDGTNVVYVDKHESPRSVRTGSRIGSRQPLYSTAMGKVLLAHAAPSVLDEVLREGMPQRSPTTITDPEALKTEIERIRVDGYAIDDQENELEIRCVGAPVFDHQGAVVAAISLSGPATRLPIERLRELSALLMNATDEVSRRLAAPEDALGHSPTGGPLGGGSGA